MSTQAHAPTTPAPFNGASLARTWQPRLFLVTSVESYFAELQKEVNINEVSRESGLFHFTTLWMKRWKCDRWDLTWVRHSKTDCGRVRWAPEPETEENKTVSLEQTPNQANHQIFPNEAVHQACWNADASAPSQMFRTQISRERNREYNMFTCLQKALMINQLGDPLY